VTIIDKLADLVGLGPNGPKAIHTKQTNTITDARNDLRAMPESASKDFLTLALELAHRSESQIFQDVFALYALGRKTGGFFVEFGATNGLELSNSLMLERDWGWHGICAEPARGWHDQFRRNRPDTVLDTRCVWIKDGDSLKFTESTAGELSTISRFKDGDSHRKARRKGQEYDVKTVSLATLLQDHEAPQDFDFLSIDTEGSEFDILSHHDFSRFQPKTIAVEHNFRKDRRKIFDLLSAKGYRRVLAEVSRFDDWYIAPGVKSQGRL
jgi:FkbM family methyltransferase